MNSRYISMLSIEFTDVSAPLVVRHLAIGRSMNEQDTPRRFKHIFVHAPVEICSRAGEKLSLSAGEFIQ
jgi:hypothetical protein